MRRVIRQWTVAEIANVRYLAEVEKMTIMQLALELHMTKNAIVGLCYRNDIKPHSLRKPKVDYIPKPADYSIPRSRIKHCKTLPNDIVVAKGTVPFPTPGYCKSIVGDIKYLQSCPCKAIVGKPWCEGHYKVYVNSSPSTLR